MTSLIYRIIGWGLVGSVIVSLVVFTLPVFETNLSLQIFDLKFSYCKSRSVGKAALPVTIQGLFDLIIKNKKKGDL